MTKQELDKLIEDLQNVDSTKIVDNDDNKIHSSFIGVLANRYEIADLFELLNDYGVEFFPVFENNVFSFEIATSKANDEAFISLGKDEGLYRSQELLEFLEYDSAFKYDDLENIDKDVVRMAKVLING